MSRVFIMKISIVFSRDIWINSNEYIIISKVGSCSIRVLLSIARANVLMPIYKI